MKEQEIKKAMIALRDAYNILNALLPNDMKREQLKGKIEDAHSKRILDVVVEVFEVDPLKKGRLREVIYARHAYRYLLRMYSPRSLQSIGLITGTDDHKTVLSSINAAKDLIQTDERYASLISQCTAKI